MFNESLPTYFLINKLALLDCIEQLNETDTYRTWDYLDLLNQNITKPHFINSFEDLIPIELDVVKGNASLLGEHFLSDFVVFGADKHDGKIDYPAFFKNCFILAEQLGYKDKIFIELNSANRFSDTLPFSLKEA